MYHAQYDSPSEHAALRLPGLSVPAIIHRHVSGVCEIAAGRLLGLQLTMAGLVVSSLVIDGSAASAPRVLSRLRVMA
jgi:hypothetical protein